MLRTSLSISWRPTAPRRTTPRRRRGIALTLALFAIVIIGALVAGGFYASTQEFRAGRNALYEPRAQAMAEFGLNATLDSLRQAAVVLQNDGDTATAAQMTRAYTFPGSPDAATVSLTRLTQKTYLLQSEGIAGGTTVDVRTTRRTGALVRMVFPEINFLAALTTNGPTQIGGSSQLSGNDENPAGWNCPTSTTAAKPAVVTNDLTNITTSGNKVTVTGASPPIQQSAAAGDTNTYFKYGDADWKSLTSMANINLPSGWGDAPLPVPLPAPAGSACLRTGANLLTNWGEPWTQVNPGHPCSTYYPIIYAAGDLRLNGGRGQGILLVEGDLEVQGRFEFYGPVIVRGRLKTTGTGGHFNGGVMAANVDLDQNVVLGDAVISYSSCAISKAITNAGVQKPVKGRGWAALY